MDGVGVIIYITILIFVVFIFVAFIFGNVSGMISSDNDTQDKICKQLYTNTTNYISCKSEHNLGKYIKRIQPIK